MESDPTRTLLDKTGYFRKPVATPSLDLACLDTVLPGGRTAQDVVGDGDENFYPISTEALEKTKIAGGRIAQDVIGDADENFDPISTDAPEETKSTRCTF